MISPVTLTSSDSIKALKTFGKVTGISQEQIYFPYPLSWLIHKKAFSETWKHKKENFNHSNCDISFLEMIHNICYAWKRKT